MRGTVVRQTTMLSATTTEQLVSHDHPIRRIKPIVEAILKELEPMLRVMYAPNGRPSVPPEHLLKSSVLMGLYTVRSDRQFCERLRYDMLFRWFLDLGIEDEVFVASTFSKNRERLLQDLCRSREGDGGVSDRACGGCRALGVWGFGASARIRRSRFGSGRVRVRRRAGRRV